MSKITLKINFKDFVEKLQGMEDIYNERIGRRLNPRTFHIKHLRKISRYLTYFLYKLKFVKGHHILFVHFILDIVALFFVFLTMPLWAFIFWFIAHIFDHCDGDLARIRNEADMKWGDIDGHLHLGANIIFWVILGFQLQLGDDILLDKSIIF